MPIEAAKAVVGTMQMRNTTLPVLRTIGQRLSCGQLQSAVQESAVDVMDESRGLRMNSLLSLLLLLHCSLLLRLLQQLMCPQLRPPLQRHSQPRSSLSGVHQLLLELPVLCRLASSFFLTMGLRLLPRLLLPMNSSAPLSSPRRGSRPSSASCSAAS